MDQMDSERSLNLSAYPAPTNTTEKHTNTGMCLSGNDKMIPNHCPIDSTFSQGHTLSATNIQRDISDCMYPPKRQYYLVSTSKFLSPRHDSNTFRYVQRQSLKRGEAMRSATNNVKRKVRRRKQILPIKLNPDPEIGRKVLGEVQVRNEESKEDGGTSGGEETLHPEIVTFDFMCHVCGEEFPENQLMEHPMSHVMERRRRRTLCHVTDLGAQSEAQAHMRRYTLQEPLRVSTVDLVQDTVPETGKDPKVDRSLLQIFRLNQDQLKIVNAQVKESYCYQVEESPEDLRVTTHQEMPPSAEPRNGIGTETEEDNFKCQVCGKIFAKAHLLRLHSKWHVEWKPYKCKMCEASFPLRQGLVRHMFKHTDERPFVCNLCGKRFKQPFVLRQHARLHTGEKPYKCTFPHCDQAFAQAAGRRYHVRNHHAQEVSHDRHTSNTASPPEQMDSQHMIAVTVPADSSN